VAEIDAVIMRKIHLFLDNLRNQGFEISKAYLFGSFVSGKTDQWSDVDLAIVSPQIGPDRFEERVKLTEIAVSVDERLEPLPFNPESFNEGDPFVRKIIKEGLAIQ